MMEGYGMAASSKKTSQIHVRVPPEFKRALKMFCVREGTTEQAWISELIETEIKNKAPDLWSKKFLTNKKKNE
jgi:predicted DNA-binding protein